MPPAKSLGYAYNAFFLRPIETAKEMEEFYVERKTPVDEMKSRIISSGKGEKLLFIGDEGSGVTTELNRLSMLLKERGFLVLTYHVKELFDLGAIDLLAFFTALAIKVYELCENGIKVEEEAKKRFESFLIDVTNLTQEEDELIRRSFRVPLSGRLRFKLNYRSRSRECFGSCLFCFTRSNCTMLKTQAPELIPEEEIEQRLIDLITEIDCFIRAIEEAEGGRVLIILDEMNFILNDEEALNLFLKRLDLIMRLSCHLILTAPVALTSRPGFDHLKKKLDGVYTLGSPVEEEDRGFFRNVIYRRMERRLIDDDATDILVNIAEDLTGLISTIRGVLTEAYRVGADRITPELVRSYLEGMKKGKRSRETPLYRYTIEEDRKLFNYEGMSGPFEHVYL